MDDKPDVEELQQRIDSLEDTVKRMMPNRREVIGMAGAGLAGAGLMSGTASAGTNSVGTIGDAPNDLVDIEAEDVTISDTLNTASISGAVAGDALLSDGNGNLQFGAAGGGIVLESGDSISVFAIRQSDVAEQFITLYDGSAKDVLGGTVSNRGGSDFLYTFADNSTLRKNGPGTSFTINNNNRNTDTENGINEVDFLPPAKNVVKVEVGGDTFGSTNVSAEVILKD